MKRFNFFKYITLANKVHTTYFNYWFFKKLTQGGEAPTEPVEGEGTEFTLSPTSNKKLTVVTTKGDTSQNTLSGKNLFNGGTWRTIKTSGGYPVPEADSATITSSDSNNIVFTTSENYKGVESDFLLLSSGTTITVSFSGTLTNRFWVTQYDSSKNRVATLNTSSTVGTTTVTTSQDGYITLAFGSTTAGSFSVNNIQIESGSTATTYEPYCGGIPSPNPDYPQDVNVVTGTQTLTITNGTDEQTYPITLGSIELCKIGTYQDYIYKSGDKWLIHKENSKVTFTGNETWYQANTNAYYYVSVPDSLLLPSSGSTPPVYCYYYSPANRNELWGKQVDYGVGLYDGATARISIRNKDCADVTAFKTWLSSHNTTVYYALATPTDTEITDSTLLSNLNTLLTDGYLKKGTNTIQTTATGTNLPTIIYIKTN